MPQGNGTIGVLVGKLRRREHVLRMDNETELYEAGKAVREAVPAGPRAAEIPRSREHPLGTPLGQEAARRASAMGAPFRWPHNPWRTDRKLRLAVTPESVTSGHHRVSAFDSFMRPCYGCPIRPAPPDRNLSAARDVADSPPSMVKRSDHSFAEVCHGL
jgi:hypothetical protein